MKYRARERLSVLLERDKEEMNAESKAQAQRELMRVAAEFFETEGEPEFTLEREKGGLRVSLTFRAVRVKNFLPLK